MVEPPCKKIKMNSKDTNQKESVDDMFEDEDNDDQDWSGVLLSSLPRLGPGSDLPAQFPAPHPSPRHTVCVELPVSRDSISGFVKPHPAQLRDVWDGHHVRLPWSQENLYPVPGDGGKKVLRSRWQLIIEALTTSPIKSSQDLEEAIISYNLRYRGSSDWSFSSLHKLFGEEFSEEESNNFFQSTLPKMVELLVSSPQILTSPLPLLTSGTSQSITMSQHQVSCLLVNAFFCTYPRRNSTKAGSEFSNYPNINFNTLYGACHRRQEAHLEKLKCLLCYFSRIINFPPSGLVTFTRKYLSPENFPNWTNSDKSMANIHLSSEGMIETEGAGMLQVDFANKFIGGGVLSSGLVQEEIRFTVCPEMIASLLFTEVMTDNEVMVITGAEQFSNYSGYSDSFVFAGRHHDKTELDSTGRRETSVVAMDAIRVTNHHNQFRQNNIERELNKAFVGFSSNLRINERLQAVATGNWGCGAFGGDLRLKFLIQLMAASENNRDIAYFTFGDKDLVREGGKMFRFLVNNKVTVGKLHSLMCQYGQSRRSQSGEDLFDYIYTNLQQGHVEAYDADTDEELNKNDEDVEKVKHTNLDEDTNDLYELASSDSHSASNSNNATKNGSDQVAPQLKNGGFFAALDRMERGELETQHEEKNFNNMDSKEITPPAPTSVTQSGTQSKVTDFFKSKGNDLTQ